MRLLLSTDTVGGVWDYATTLAGAVTEQGAEVMLAVIGPSDALSGRAIPAGVEVVSADHPLEWMSGAGAAIAPAAEWLVAMARSWNAEVVHLNQMAYTAHRFPAPTVVVAHSDVLSWFSETRGTAAPNEWASYAGCIREGLAGATAVISPTRYQAELLRRHYGRAPDRVIHNAAPPPAPAAAVRRQPLIVSAGRAWDEAKGMDLLDEALLLLGGDAPDAHLFGSTDGPHGQRFRARRLHCHGGVDKEALSRWMRGATLYVGASRYEPFGLAPLEAALHGCPLLLSDIGSFRELWEGCATLFRSGDSASLAAAIRALTSDPGSRDARAAAARERARNLYTMERMVGEYLEVYRRLTGAALHTQVAVKG